MPIVRHRRPPDGLLRRAHLERYMTHLPFSYRALRRGDYDVAHAVYPTDALAAARWSRRTGRPSVLAYHGIPDEAGLTERRLQRRITRRAAEGCSAVVVSSRTAADAFRRTLGIEARVIHPGVDLSAFAPGPGRPDEPTIFCAAPLDVPRKRVGLLIAAHSLVRQRRPGARLRLLRPSDPRVAGELERSDRGIELVDPVERATDLAALYRQSWVSALPSVNESFGMVLVESLACGVPVVATNRDALPEVVDRDTIGRLFDGDDERALATAILEALDLSEDPANREECRRRAEDFSTRRYAEAHESLYADLMAGAE
jgi:glycosyltransferase involved in cell wall biosynthesis